MKERKDLPFPHKNRTRGLKLRWVGCIYPNGAHNGQVKVRLSDRAKPWQNWIVCYLNHQLFISLPKIMADYSAMTYV